MPKPIYFHYRSIVKRCIILTAFADSVLKELSPVFNGMHSKVGRPSIPPERLLKARMLIALYSVRSDCLFAEMLDFSFVTC